MATSSPDLPFTYSEKWKDLKSITTIDDFYKAFPSDGSIAPREMLNLYLTNDDNAFPVGLWCLVKTPKDQHRIVTLHTIKKAPSIIGKTSQLAGKTIAIQNDVHQAGHMSMRILRDEDGLFDTTDDVMIPTIEAVEVQYASSVNSGNDLIRPVPKGADSESIVTYMGCPIPLDLLRLSVNKLYSPKELYDKALKWTKEEKLTPNKQPYLAWLRACMTTVSDGKKAPKPPATRIGDLDVQLPALTVGEEEDDIYLLNQMKKDLPGRFRNDDTRDSILAASLKEMHKTNLESAAKTRVREQEQAQKQEKTWEKHSIYVKAKLSKLLKTTDEANYPEVYGFIIKTKKAEWRNRGRDNIATTRR